VAPTAVTAVTPVAPSDSPGDRDRRPGQAPSAGQLRRWAWLAALIAGLTLYEIVRQAYLNTANANLVPSLLLLGAVTGPATFVVFIYGRDWQFDVGGATVMAVGFVGGIIGVTAASLLEYHTLVTLGSLPLIAVAVIEEAVKLAAPLAVLLLRRSRRPVNGMLVGVASGAGFAIMETLGYSAVELIQSHENVAEVNSLLLHRGLFSPTTHMAWTGLTATALWYAASRGWNIRGLAVFAAVFLAASVLHATWDMSNSLAAYVTIGLLSLAAFIAVAERLSHHHRIEQPAPEPA
jgi:protease PrsW